MRRTEVPWGETVPERDAAASQRWELIPAPQPAALGLALTDAGPPDDAPKAASPGQAAQFIGQVIDDRYRIVQLLGEGGMGAVFVAEHLKLRKQVAVKTIRAEFASNALAEARFAREALATAQLDHPHVASAIDFGHLPDGGAYLVTQLVRGVSLARLLETRGALTWSTAADLGAQIADALAAAHAAGIVHRDLKPDNILIETRDDGQLRAKVVDFGIARLSEETAGAKGQPLTRMGAILGTPGYMAPEQAVGEAVDARGDLYALGVMLWECCVGRRLWQGESVTELVACQLGSTPATLQHELGSRVPQAFSELVAQLLSAAPSKRPDAAGPVRDALRRLALQQTAPGTSTASESARPFVSTVALPTSLIPTAPRLWTPTGAWQRLRSRRGAVPAVAGGLALLLVLCLALCRGGDPAPATPTTPASAPVVAAPADEPKARDGDDTPRAPTPTPAETPPVQPPIEPPVQPPAEPPAKAIAPPVEAPAPPDAPPSTPPPTADAPEVPAELAAALATLLGDGDRSDRKRAADRVIEHKPKAPVFMLNLAWLEKASSCSNKRAVLLKMEETPDPRMLPALRRLAATKRRGCGFFNSQDCFGCLRETLARVIGRLDPGP